MNVDPRVTLAPDPCSAVSRAPTTAPNMMLAFTAAVKPKIDVRAEKTHVTKDPILEKRASMPVTAVMTLNQRANWKATPTSFAWD